jgi:preprotein translocase subunit YajC
MVTKLFLSILILPGLVLGCGRGLDLEVRFDTIDGLAKGHAVVFEGNVIGEVTKITYQSPGTYQVAISIVSGFEAAATEHSRFSIGPSPLDPERKAVVMVHEKKGGAPLARGSVVQGRAPDPLAGLRPLAEQFRQGFDAFLQDLQKIPETEAYKTFEQELDELAGTMKNSSGAVREEIRNTVIPLIKKQLEAFRRSLERLGRGDEVTPLEKKLDAIQEI